MFRGIEACSQRLWVGGRRRAMAVRLGASHYRIILAVLLLAAGVVPQGAIATTRPNIVFILADDLGFGDLRCYGHPYAKTPNLDRLAAEGTRFNQAYSAGVTCVPSRAGVMTGKRPATFPMSVDEHGFQERITITEILKRRGYRTGHFGKWHMGPNTEAGTYGIDEIAGGDTKQAVDSRRALGRDAGLFDAAIGFIQRHSEDPFYVNVWGHVSHFPVNPPESYSENFSDLTVNREDFSRYMQTKFDHCESKGGNVDQAMRNYLGAILSLDENVGRLLAELDQLGLRENTIVVFSSDQGPAPVNASARAVAKQVVQGNAATERFRVNMLGYAGDLRGGKHTNYEGGVRIPLIIRWPGHVPSGRLDEDSMVSGIDWLPTLCALTGSTIEPNDFDGENVALAWLGETHVRSRPLLWRTGAGDAIRDGRWKLHLSPRSGSPVELYELVLDVGERRNVAKAHPDVVARLSDKIAAWTAALPR